jgi:hypothetical protein
MKNKRYRAPLPVSAELAVDLMEKSRPKPRDFSTVPQPLLLLNKN